MAGCSSRYSMMIGVTNAAIVAVSPLGKLLLLLPCRHRLGSDDCEGRGRWKIFFINSVATAVVAMLSRDCQAVRPPVDSDPSQSAKPSLPPLTTPPSNC